MKRSLFLLCLFLIGSYGVARFSHHQTDGFRMSKIWGNFPISEEDNSKSPLPKELSSALSQKFHYLGRGLQSFAFVSDDQTTVIKIFNNRYQQKAFWFSLLPACESKAQYNLGKLKKMAESYQLANSELSHETGLHYLHIQPSSHLKKTVTIVDKLGIEHSISLDQFGFALQKKVTLAYPYLLQLKQANQTAKAKEALSSLFNLLLHRCQMGIADKDPLIRTNVGFIENKALLIDIGPFSKDPSIQDSQIYRKEILRITASLKHWISQNYKELSPFVENTLENLLEASHEKAI